MDIKAVSDGIYAVFVADSDLKTALGGNIERRLYDTKGPQNPTFPYAVFQYISGDYDLAFGELFEVTQWQFSMFNKDGDPLDKTTLNDVFKKLAVAYDEAEATMTVSGYSVISVTRGVSNFLPTVDETQQFVISYEIMIQKDR